MHIAGQIVTKELGTVDNVLGISERGRSFLEGFHVIYMHVKLGVNSLRSLFDYLSILISLDGVELGRSMSFVERVISHFQVQDPASM